jgi:Helicase HerA-like C-terminal
MKERLETLELDEPTWESCPVVFWGVYCDPVRATISDMGPLLLGRLLNLNDPQSGVLTLVFGRQRQRPAAVAGGGRTAGWRLPPAPRQSALTFAGTARATRIGGDIPEPGRGPRQRRLSGRLGTHALLYGPA